jgi:hypothetical protein
VGQESCSLQQMSAALPVPVATSPGEDAASPAPHHKVPAKRLYILIAALHYILDCATYMY